MGAALALLILFRVEYGNLGMRLLCVVFSFCPRRYRSLDETQDAAVWSKIPGGSRAQVKVAAIPGTTVGGVRPFGETLGMTSVEGEHNAVTGGDSDADSYLPMEPFIGGMALHHAQWPNRIAEDAIEEDSTNWKWTNVASPGGTSSSADSFGALYKTQDFEYMSAAPFGSWTDWEDVVAHGFWSVDWFDGYLPVKKSSSTSGKLSVGMPASKEFAQAMDELNEGARFAVLNSFDALDMPGEYVFKRTVTMTASDTGYIYFIPPASAAGDAELLVSTNAKALITVDSMVDGVTIEGVNLEVSRGSGITISSDNVRVFDSKVLNMGTKGVEATGSFVHIKSSEIGYVGGNAVYLDGGHRGTLTPSGNVIEKSTIHHSPRRTLHYAECLNLGGVGNVARENTIFAAPAAVVELTGNNHVIEYNTIHHVALDTFDTGAIHWASFNPASWGMKINHNLIYKVGFKNNACSSSTSCMLAGIYADDGSFGFEAIGNVIWLPEPAARDRAAGALAGWFTDEIQTIGVFVNAGSRNTVTNNVFVDAQFAYSNSGGFMVAGGFGATPPIKATSGFYKDMRKMKWNTPGSVYAVAYPALSQLLDSYPVDCNTNPKCPAAPFGETVSKNIGIQITGLKTSEWAAKTTPGYPNIFQLPSAFNDDDGGKLTFADSNFGGLSTNVAGSSAEILAAGTGYGSAIPDFRLKPNWGGLPAGWTPIAIDATGLTAVPAYTAPASSGPITDAAAEDDDDSGDTSDGGDDSSADDDDDDASSEGDDDNGEGDDDAGASPVPSLALLIAALVFHV